MNLWPTRVKPSKRISPKPKHMSGFFFHSVNLSDIGLSYQFTYRFTFENEISERERERDRHIKIDRDIAYPIR